jgi:hypothetical protein
MMDAAFLIATLGAILLIVTGVAISALIEWRAGRKQKLGVRPATNR